MIFTIPFKKELNRWYKTFAWLPKRMTNDPDKVVWLGFYWRAWIVVYVYKMVPRYTMSSTDTKTTYSKADLQRLRKSTNTSCGSEYLIKYL